MYSKMARSSGQKQEAPVLNIQSYIRIRPLAPKERRSLNLKLGKGEVTIKSSLEGKAAKVLAFDRVFEEEVSQGTVYSSTVKSMIQDIIQGYNCTVFAYGQTGTGKTYTMSGHEGDASTSWENDIHAGIIPRALGDIFEQLSENNYEYQVSITFVELYNEKLRNLLSDINDETKIQLIDDSDGGVILKGLSPTPVNNKAEAFQLLRKGSERKHVAATLLNIHSSRSHSILTIYVNIKESTIEKNDLLRMGKLNLVDLAGSENVSKSGASQKTASGVNKRLTEASIINKSLLTLGRVITSITENNPHIPYRESKLTRLLRDSLGGKTKTCLIGTISPAHTNMDETESTLNYAYKARSIKNKPEKNQTISKKEFMQVASEEILKLKRDLEAVRQGDGFYISKESHEEMTTHINFLDNQVKEWNERYDALKTTYEHLKEQFSSLSDSFDDKCSEYEELDKLFKNEAMKYKQSLEEVKQEIIVREYFIKQYEKTEQNLTEEAKQCKSVLENLMEQNDKLHNKLSAKKDEGNTNANALEHFKSSLVNKLREIEEQFLQFYTKEDNCLKSIAQMMGNTLDGINEGFASITSYLSEYERLGKENLSQLLQTNSEMKRTMEGSMEEAAEELETFFVDHSTNADRLNNFFVEGISTIRKKLTEALMKVPDVENIKTIVNDAHFREDFQRNYAGLKRVSEEILQHFTMFESEMDLAIKLANKSKMSSLEVSMKLEKLKKDLLDIELTNKNTTLKAEDTERYLKDVTTNVKKSKETLQSSMEVLEDSTRNNNEEMIRKLETILEEEMTKSIQVFREIDPVGNDLSSLHDCFQTDSEDLLNTMSYESRNYTEKMKSVIDLHQLFSHMNGTAEERQKFSQQCCKTVNELSDKTETSLENNLRHNQHQIFDNAQLLKDYVSKESKTLQAVQLSVQDMRYLAQKSQEKTPQKGDIDYPKQFTSTAPRSVLLKQFHQVDLSTRQQESHETISTASDEMPRIKLQRSRSNQDISADKTTRQQESHEPISTASDETPSFELQRSRSIPDISADKERRKKFSLQYAKPGLELYGPPENLGLIYTKLLLETIRTEYASKKPLVGSRSSRSDSLEQLHHQDMSTRQQESHETISTASDETPSFELQRSRSIPDISADKNKENARSPRSRKQNTNKKKLTTRSRSALDETKSKSSFKKMSS